MWEAVPDRGADYFPAVDGPQPLADFASILERITRPGPSLRMRSAEAACASPPSGSWTDTSERYPVKLAHCSEGTAKEVVVAIWSLASFSTRPITVTWMHCAAP